MMKFVEALRMRRAWLRLVRQRIQLFGVNRSGHRRILSSANMTEAKYFKTRVISWQIYIVDCWTA